jgi:hypothetical protein
MSAAAVAGGLQIAAIDAAPLPSYAIGSIRIPETQTAVVHQDEMILPAQTAEAARREGITIGPSGSGGVPAILQIMLDGKKIAESDVTYINSGSVGRIDTRVVR